MFIVPSTHVWVQFDCVGAKSGLNDNVAPHNPHFARLSFLKRFFHAFFSNQLAISLFSPPYQKASICKKYPPVKLGIVAMQLEVAQ